MLRARNRSKSLATRSREPKAPAQSEINEMSLAITINLHAHKTSAASSMGIEGVRKETRLVLESLDTSCTRYSSCARLILQIPIPLPRKCTDSPRRDEQHTPKKPCTAKGFPTWRPTRVFTVPVRYPYGTRTVPVRSPVSKHVVPVHSLREKERKQYILFSIKKTTGTTCFDTGERTGTVRVPYGYRTGTVKIQVFRACFFSEAFPSIIQRFNVPCCQPPLADSRCNATTVMTEPD